MNNVSMTGNLTRDPELKDVNGQAVVNFGIANNDHKDHPVFIECAAWGKQAEFIAKYFQKGKAILIEQAQLNLDTWEKDGNKHSKISLNFVRASFFGFKTDDSPSVASAPVKEEPVDDIPY